MEITAQEMLERLEDFKEFLIENERAENTVKNYEFSIREFAGRYSELNKYNLLDYKRHEMEEKSPKTVNLRICALNQFCKFLGHPELAVRRVKIQKTFAVENVITLQEYQRFLNGLLADGNEKGYWMVKFLAKTGARVSEFVRLTKGDLEKGYCELLTKGKVRRIYIPKDLIEESRDYFSRQNSVLLFTTRSGHLYSTRGLTQNIKRWGAWYGIRTEVLHPHSFRHLYAVEFLKRNSNIALLADLMGHSNVSTTSIYLRLSKEEQMKQFNEAVSAW